ncbi:MAG: hypothetical protein ACOWWM_13575 [Desulfobacterales bacterium]
MGFFADIIHDSRRPPPGHPGAPGKAAASAASEGSQPAAVPQADAPVDPRAARGSPHAEPANAGSLAAMGETPDPPVPFPRRSRAPGEAGDADEVRPIPAPEIGAPSIPVRPEPAGASPAESEREGGRGEPYEDRLSDAMDHPRDAKAEKRASATDSPRRHALGEAVSESIVPVADRASKDGVKPEESSHPPAGGNPDRPHPGPPHPEDESIRLPRPGREAAGLALSGPSRAPVAQRAAFGEPGSREEAPASRGLREPSRPGPEKASFDIRKPSFAREGISPGGTETSALGAAAHPTDATGGYGAAVGVSSSGKSAPPEPRVRIGVIEVVVISPEPVKPLRKPSQPSPAGFTSRHYLRNL